MYLRQHLDRARYVNGDHSMADAARRFVNNVETIIQEMVS